MTAQAAVREFHKAFDLVVRDEIQVDGIPADEVTRITKLLCEEVAELLCAMHGLGNAGDLADVIEGLVDWHALRAPRRPFDVAEVARESADVLAMVYGASLNYGYDLDVAFAEVIAACMRKRGRDGAVNRRDDGKVLKPEGWEPPNVARAIGVEA